MPLQKYLAEVLGTFTLTLAVWFSLGFATPLATPIAAALTVGLFVYTIGAISGAHLNPAVTCGLMSVKKIQIQEGVFYIIAQFVGAILAMVFGRIVTGEIVHVAAGVSVATAVAEALGAFFLVFGIASVVFKNVQPAASGLVVGGSLLLGMYVAVGAHLSNGVLNPAVALAIGSFNIVYLLAPVVGGILGAQTYRYFSEA